MCTLEAKNGSSVTVDWTKVHSTMSGTPLRPFKHASAKTAPAYLYKYKKFFVKKIIKRQQESQDTLHLHSIFLFFDLRHGQGCRALSSLCLDNFSPTILCPLGKSLDVFMRQCVGCRSCLCQIKLLSGVFNVKSVIMKVRCLTMASITSMFRG
jgi:hypothetical protein